MAFAVSGPLDLRATTGVLQTGAHDPSCRATAGELWWATPTPIGPGTLHLRQHRDSVEVEAWGPGADWLEAQVPALLGEHDDTKDFVPDHHPVVAAAAHRHPGLRIGRSGLVLPPLIAAVLAQRVTGLESVRAWSALCRVLGEPAPGPAGLRLPPRPERLAASPYWWYHRFGIEGHRAATLRRVGQHAARLQEAAGFAPADAERRLRAVRGIGAWSAALVAGSAFGDPDAVPVGDYNLPNDVAWALAGEPRGDDTRMLELLAPFAGHRGRVLRLLMADGRRAPRFGPRRPIEPIAHR